MIDETQNYEFSDNDLIPNNIVEDIPIPTNNETYLGTLDVSHYTNETNENIPKEEGGKYDMKGNLLVEYESIAMPKYLYEDLSYGSKIKIIAPNGEIYYGRAVDTGSVLNKLNRIDRCVSTYKEATDLGIIKNCEIYKIEE
jgi:hypothetical protein